MGELKCEFVKGHEMDNKKERFDLGNKLSINLKFFLSSYLPEFLIHILNTFNQ